MAIAKTASRNVAFKVARMRESIMEDQDEFIIRNLGRDEAGSKVNNRAALEDVGYNTDLYIANQECNAQNQTRLTSAEFRVLHRWRAS